MSHIHDICYTCMCNIHDVCYTYMCVQLQRRVYRSSLIYLSARKGSSVHKNSVDVDAAAVIGSSTGVQAFVYVTHIHDRCSNDNYQVYKCI